MLRKQIFLSIIIFNSCSVILSDDISSKNIVISDSTVIDFFPGELPYEYSWIRKYSKFPEGEVSLPLKNYSGTITLFWRGLKCLNADYRPAVSFIKERLVLIPSKTFNNTLAKEGFALVRNIPRQKEDIAFLRYKIDAINILIACTAKRHYVFIRYEDVIRNKSKTSPMKDIAIVTSLVNTFLNKLHFDNVKIKELDKEHNDFKVFQGVSKKWSFVCILDTKDVLFIIPKHASGMRSAYTPLPDEWFEWTQKVYGHIPIESLEAQKKEPIKEKDGKQKTWKEELISVFMDISSKRGKYADVESRVSAVRKVKSEFQEKKKESLIENKELLEIRKFLVYSFVHIAVNEPDNGAKQMILFEALSLIKYEPTSEKKNKDHKQLEAAVDALIKEMIKAKGEEREKVISVCSKNSRFQR